MSLQLRSRSRTKSRSLSRSPPPSPSRLLSSTRSSPPPDPDPDSDLDLNLYASNTTALNFRMGRKIITATKAEQLDCRRPVYRLTRTPTFFDRLPQAMRLVLRYFLKLCCPWVQNVQPHWFLPQIIILKKQKPSWENEFAAEIRAYKILESVQGSIVPYFYGIATYDGSPTIVLSEVCGERLYELATTPKADDPMLHDKIYKAFKVLYDHGMNHGDSELHNIFKVGQDVMFIDFEFALFGEDQRAWEESMNKADARNVISELQAK